MVENVKFPSQEMASPNLFRPGSLSYTLVPCVANAVTGKFVPLYTVENYAVQFTRRGCKKLSPLDRGGRTSRRWTEKEDERLRSLVEELGQHSWKAVSEQLNTDFDSSHRSSKHCKERWANHINPGLNKGRWTFREDITLLNEYKVHPNKWTLIAQNLPGRNQTLVKNRFWTLFKRTKDTYDMHYMDTHHVLDFLIGQLSTFITD